MNAKMDKRTQVENEKLGKSKQSKKEAETGQRIYKSRWKLNKAFKEQVGFASKSAGVERLGLSYQKAYQDELARAREIYQDNQTAAVTTVNAGIGPVPLAIVSWSVVELVIAVKSPPALTKADPL